MLNRIQPMIQKPRWMRRAEAIDYARISGQLIDKWVAEGSAQSSQGGSQGHPFRPTRT